MATLVIEAKDLLKLFADHDYPIIYPDKSIGRGMGYNDFEKLIEFISENYGRTIDDNAGLQEPGLDSGSGAQEPLQMRYMRVLLSEYRRTRV